MDMTTDAMTWTIAYRKRTANRFLRVSNWQGTWTQAVAMAAVFSETNPELQVYYVPTAEAEQDGATPEDIGNVLVDSGKRIRIAEGGGVPDEMIARIPTPEAARERWLDGTEIAEPESTTAPGWMCVDAMLYRHNLTGIMLRRLQTTSRWHLLQPRRIGMSPRCSARTIKAAIVLAECADGLVESMLATIARAWDEAHAEGTS
jgi:hypothetical protein